MYTQITNLSVIPEGVRPVVHCSQFDNHLQAIRFNLFKQGQPFTIPNYAAVIINGYKPDNTAFSYAASAISGTTVTFGVTQQMTAVAGDVLCELRVRTDTEIIGTLNFILRVEKAPLTDDSVLSETEIPLIEQAVDIAANLAEYIQQTLDAKDDAEAAATAAANSASDAAIDAASAASDAASILELYDSIETAKTNANTAAEAANTAAQGLTGFSAEATTLPAGSEATATYNSTTKKFSFGLPVGATGASGVTTPLLGFFTMWVDTNGDLYVAAADDMSDYFEYDEDTGNLYFLTEDGN